MEKGMGNSEAVESLDRYDERSFEMLLERFRPKLFGWLFSRVQCNYEASEVTQQVLLAAWESKQKYEPDRPSAPWLWGIAKNIYKKHIRTTKRERVINYVENIEAIAVTDSSVNENADRRRILAVRLRAARKLLSDRDRVVFNMWVKLVLRGNVRGDRPPNGLIAELTGFSIDEVRGSTRNIRRVGSSSNCKLPREGGEDL